MPKFTRVETPREIRHRLPDHEVLLAFFDDSGAGAFDVWWHSTGADLFGEWCEKSEYFGHLVEQ